MIFDQTLAPVLARTIITRRGIESSEYDCVSFCIIRDGSMLFTADDGLRPLTLGDCLLTAPHTPIRCLPEGEVMLTLLLIDTDYLIEHLFWQHLAIIPDRDAARDLAAKLYPDPVQMLHLGERQLERLGSILDDLVMLTSQEQSPSSYFRAHALLFTVLATIAPLVRHAPVGVPPFTSYQHAKRVAPPRWRAYRPIRREAALTTALMQNDITKHWPLAELAAHACLSPSQLARVFVNAFGVSPHTYLSILRAQRMAKLVRETDEPISMIYRRVGWSSRGHASIIFRRYLGVNPSEYRRYGPPSASQDGPGIGVARAARSANESAEQPVGGANHRSDAVDR